MNGEIRCVTKEKQLRMNGKMMTLTFFELYAVYIKWQFFFHTYLLTCLRKLLLKVIFEQVKKLSIKTLVLIFLKNTLYMHTIPSIKL